MSEEETGKRVWRIKAKHEAYCIYEVEADDYKDAIDQICGIELFQSHGEELVGPCSHTMEHHGIRLIEMDCSADPAPTGIAYTQRDWELEDFASVDEADEDSGLNCY
jgi:hypothetical protein